MTARKPKIKSFALRIPAGLYRKVYSEALKQDRSVNVTMEMLIRQGLKSLSIPTAPSFDDLVAVPDEWPDPSKPEPITLPPTWKEELEELKRLTALANEEKRLTALANEDPETFK